MRCGDEIRCAKVYKEASKRSFKQAVVYQEGRRVRSSRDARAMEKGSSTVASSTKRCGRTPRWMPCSLAAAGVRVPRPYVCLLMACC